MVRIEAFFFSAIMMLVSASVMAGDKPNIIVMVADDLGWADVGFHGNQVIETPSLDRIAQVLLQRPDEPAKRWAAANGHGSKLRGSPAPSRASDHRP